jgi:predicted phage tail protein
MLTVKLLGLLGDKFGEVWQLDCRTAAEVFRAIGAQEPDFLPFILAEKNPYAVCVDGQNIGEDGLFCPIFAECTIEAVVVAAGGIERILLGAGSLILGAIFPPAFTLFGTNIAAAIGASLVLGGITSLLAPAPATSKKNNPSTIFGVDGVLNAAEGSTIPVIFGDKVWVDLDYGQLISLQIHNNDLPVDFEIE